MNVSAAPASLLPRPWLDRRGRLSPLRAGVFGALWLPALWYAAACALNALGPRPLHATLLGTGLWTIWWLMISLTITPAKAVLGLPGIVVVRRMIGLAALCYGLAHLVLYVADEKWRLLHVGAEIALRFYLTIGFVALAVLAVLGWTSRDAWTRRLGASWKRLHKLAYAVGILGAFHYYMQTKADVSNAVLVSGVFLWLMLWRQLPAGRDRGPVALAVLAAAAAVATMALEFAWYGLATKVDPWRVLSGEFDIQYGLKPAGQVLALGLLVAAAAELHRVASSRRGETLWASLLVYAGGGALAGLLTFTMGWGDPDADNDTSLAMLAAWTVLAGFLGYARWLVVGRPAQRWVGALWAACLACLIATTGLDSPPVGLAIDGLVAAAVLGLSARLWTESRASAVLVVPAAAWLGYAMTAFWSA